LGIIKGSEEGGVPLGIRGNGEWGLEKLFPNH
jgi:hypothetical protein